jgi:hypothetical protein
MPDEGLVESCESLAETYDYYLARAHGLLAPSGEPSRVYEATAGAAYVRPSFKIADEE